VGRFCVGARARLVNTDDAGGIAVRQNVSRTGADLLLVAARPISRGRLTLAPVGAVGVGWVRTVLSPGSQEEAVSGSGFGLRLEGGVNVGFAFSSRWALIGELGATLARPGSGRLSNDGAPMPGTPAGFFRGTVGWQLTL